MLRKATEVPRSETIVPRVKEELIPSAAQVTKSTPAVSAVSADPKKLDLIAKKKKVEQSKRLFGLVALFMFGILLLFFIAFLLIYTVTSPENNPFIRLFGLQVEEWIPFLINLISFFFGLAVLIAFFVGLVGVFKFAMSPKDDMVARRKGIAMSMIGSMVLIILIVVWMFTYVWLDGKRALYVNSGPVDYIATSPEMVTGLTAPMVVEFDASPVEDAVNPIQKEILSYVWHFGDGAKQTGQKVSHEYLRKGEVDGSYTVTLSVRYRDLKTGEEAIEDFHKTIVFDNEKVAAAFTMDKETGAYPLEIAFDASESIDPDGTIIDYLWDFDSDGDYDDGAGVKVNYTFTQMGEYTAKLKVVDDSKDFALAEKQVIVTDSLEPRAIIDVLDHPTGKYYINTEYTFDASGSTSPRGPIVKYKWDLGDGTTGTTRTFSHTFTRLGTYIVQLEVEDIEKNKTFSSIEVEVSKPDSAPTAVIEPTPGFTDSKGTYLEGTVPFEVSFSALKSSDPDDDIVEYEWDFDGDGTIDSAGAVVSYQYATVGEFSTVLYVIDAAGNKTSRNVRVVVEKQGLRAYMTASVVEGEVPLQVTFDASASSYPEGKIISYQWNFGDGSAPRFGDSKISYEYTRIGEFAAVVTVKADDGAQESSTVNVNIRPVSVRACFEADNESGSAPLTVIFRTSCSTGTISQYTWKIEGVNTPASPQHRLNFTFENPGSYDVQLTVRDPDGVIDSFTKTVTVTQVR